VLASPQPVENHNEDGTLAAKCLAGDEEASRTLREQHYHRLVSVAIRRGATATEATDLVADVWGDLTSPGEGKRPLLEKYRAQCPLSAWLITVVTHRFIDRRRRERLFVDVPTGTVENFQPAPKLAPAESELTRILREAVAEAFGACDPETLVILKLVYIHGVSQREIGRAWNWHESKVSRHLDRALGGIQAHVLDKIKRTDGFLDVNWDDFLALCQNTRDLFGHEELD
jgi:RNA polymerase sigma factor (sigma-70 family)